MKVSREDITYSPVITYSYDQGLQLPHVKSELWGYNRGKAIVDEMVYIAEKYVAYATMKVNFENHYLDVEFSNIRRKEYFADEISGVDKVTDGLKHIKEAKDYVKSCGNEWNSDILVQRFV